MEKVNGDLIIETEDLKQLLKNETFKSQSQQKEISKLEGKQETEGKLLKERIVSLEHLIDRKNEKIVEC